MKRNRRLYLAYGSNLYKHGMRKRCPDAVPRGRVILGDARLVFRGVADVVYEPNSEVPCGLWWISPEDEKALDRYEGVGSNFYNKDEVDLGKGQTALIYTMNATGIMPPSQFYADVIEQGYEDFGLDKSYLFAALRHAWKKKEPCEQTIARRKRQRASDLHRRLVMPESLGLKMLNRRLARVG